MAAKIIIYIYIKFMKQNKKVSFHKKKRKMNQWRKLRMKKRNLVLIMCDQLRKDFLGCYGNEYVNTPNIDSLAAHSTVFDHCYVNNPICMPSRMSIFTGLYPHNHNQWTNGNQLEHPLRTLADHLHDNGYHTGSIGKLHFQCTDCGKNAPHISMEDHRLWEEKGDNIDWYGPYWGFEHVEFTSGHATKPLAHYGKWYHEHGGKDEWAIAKPVEGFDACPVTTMPENLHDSMFVGERAAAYISEHANDDQPFFLTASFPDPHHPFNPPLETALRYKDVPVKMPVNEDDDLHTRPRHYHYHQYGVWHRAGLLHPLPDMPEEDKEKCGKCADQIAQFMDEKILQGLGLLTHGDSSGEEYKPSVLSAHERDQRIRNTYAMVDLIDKGVGKILDALKESGALEDTVIIFTADHGELMGDHGLWLKGPFFYDGLVNVPLMMHTPEDNASVTEALASSVDIYPTCCELLGVPTPRSCDGMSQAAALRGEKVRTECLFEYRNGYFENDVYTLGYVDEKYKFVQYQNGDVEMTDRINDPEENVNIVYNGANPELLAEYRNKLLNMMLNTASKFPEQYCHA